MNKTLIALGVAAVTLIFGSAARAELACGSLLMPAAQLKEVSRGITGHHTGLDLIAPHGSPLRSSGAGTVVAAHDYYGYGLMVDLDHGNGVLTRYAHMASFAPGIRPGTKVAAGQLLGQVGRTGRTTTAHVHFEVRINGRAVDPKPYLSLATCTPRTPTMRFDEARAPTRQVTDAAQVANAQVTNALGARAIIPIVPRLDARPGGLLE